MGGKWRYNSYDAMDQDLKQYLDQRFGAVDRRSDGLDKRIEGLDRKIEGLDRKIDAVQVSMFQRMDEMAASLEEGYRDTRTEVLKAVYSMGERLQTRAATQDAILSGLQQRQASLESRLLEIEKRLNLPPAA
jgi:chromosome segregation ATPase